MNQSNKKLEAPDTFLEISSDSPRTDTLKWEPATFVESASNATEILRIILDDIIEQFHVTQAAVNETSFKFYA